MDKQSLISKRNDGSNTHVNIYMSRKTRKIYDSFVELKKRLVDKGLDEELNPTKETIDEKLGEKTLNINTEHSQVLKEFLKHKCSRNNVSRFINNFYNNKCSKIEINGLEHVVPVFPVNNHDLKFVDKIVSTDIQDIYEGIELIATSSGKLQAKHMDDVVFNGDITMYGGIDDNGFKVFEGDFATKTAYGTRLEHEVYQYLSNLKKKLSVRKELAKDISNLVHMPGGMSVTSVMLVERGGEWFARYVERSRDVAICPLTKGTIPSGHIDAGNSVKDTVKHEFVTEVLGKKREEEAVKELNNYLDDGDVRIEVLGGHVNAADGGGNISTVIVIKGDAVDWVDSNCKVNWESNDVFEVPINKIFNNFPPSNVSPNSTMAMYRSLIWGELALGLDLDKEVGFNHEIHL